MNTIILCLHFYLWMMQLACTACKHARSHPGKRTSYRRHIPTAIGYKREIRIGFKVCGKPELTSATNAGLDQGKGNLDIDSLLKDIKEHSLRKRGWSKNWVEKLDQCCSTHDTCPRIVPPRATKHGYHNNLDYKVYDCECDDNFALCLKEAESFAADAVGDLYFNVLHIPCLKYKKNIPDLTSEHTDVIVQKVKGHENGNHISEVTNPDVVFHLFGDHNHKSSESSVVKLGTLEKESGAHLVGKQIPDHAVVEKVVLKPEDKIQTEVKHPTTSETEVDKEGAKVTLITQEEDETTSPANPVLTSTHDEKLTPIGEKIMNTKAQEVALIHVDNHPNTDAENQQVGIIPVVQSDHVNPEKEKVFLASEHKTNEISGPKKPGSPSLTSEKPEDHMETVIHFQEQKSLLEPNEKSDLDSLLVKMGGISEDSVPERRRAKHFEKSKTANKS